MLFPVFILLITVKSIFSQLSDEVVQIPELTDSKWDQIQKGQWLIAFFDEESKESIKLKEDWKIMSVKCKEQDINVAQIMPQNPGLHVRFLVTTFPKVFYVRNGVAHEVKQPNRLALVDLIHNKKWKELKPVSFMKNPFSIQMSLLSHLFIHAVNLYNYEDAIVRQYLYFSSATDVVFALTFIVVGTFFGLLITIIVSLLQEFVFSSKRDTEEDEDEKVEKTKEKKTDKKEKVVKKDDSDAVRKRK